MKPASAHSPDWKAAAVALARWGLGVMFLFYGIGKLPDIQGFAGGYLAPQFQNTWLPRILVVAFGFVLPFMELAIGACLILGLWRNPVLVLTALLLIALTFGQVVLQQPPVVFYNLGYLFFTVALLFLHEFDRWILFPRESRKAP